ncbi:putative glycosyl hydrolase or carbohydrate binding protein [Algoriphagus boseongensis]|uniref:Putative glycosyl hydrolase or carbohydrate binding protein n=1 Tax=Algoriphagus boseongensis TaxID=1442587 RepID=A0A4R6T9Y9_9BACT|nr:PCMD domain-containing protein [Algoriphagus boseongensis]TDQ19023.1 putative glycosyl hydrolase or carbohydrate binding protein [Algoriphagus boseongensis]
MKKYSILFFSTIFLFSCVKEDFFGLSNYGNIKSIVVSNQASNPVINTNEFTVEVEIPAGVDLSNISIQSLELSSFATADKQVGDKLDLREPQQILVRAEDGSLHTWTITSFVASATPQLNNGNLNQWYKTGSDYYEPGKDAASTIWGTGNPGTQILNKLATVPFDLGNGNLAAQMITLDNGRLAGTFGAPISAGSIFTGVFDSDKIDPSNPQAAIDFGTPFSGRPEKLRLKYKYQAGEVNKDKQGNELGYPDMLDIYALLEIRLGGKTERLATAWFRSSNNQADMIVLEIPFTYGELDSTFPDYMKPVDQAYVSSDSAAFVLPTHIIFVASSSFDGANFSGAIGSTLIIDDVEMVYKK